MLAIMLVAALGAGIWWLVGRDPNAGPLDGDGPTEPSLPVARNVVPAVAPVPRDPAVKTVAAEAVARPDEDLPRIRPSEAPPLIPVPSSLYRMSDGTLLGADLLAAMVSVRLRPVRFDSQETRERFGTTRFKIAMPRPLAETSSSILLFEVKSAISLDDSYSCRLDEYALWIGTHGVY